MTKKIALIPSYEPDSDFTYLLKDLKKLDFDIIVVNDGSGDKYDSIFDNLKDYSTVLSYNVNHGKGYALKTGLKYIKEKYVKDYVVVTMDCDGQHTVEDTNKICLEAINDKNALILGKRLRNENTPKKSKFGNSFTSFFLSVSTGLKIYDTQTGLRAFSDNIIDKFIYIEGDRYEYEMNMLLACPANGISIKEIEISTIYFNNNSNSHFKALKDSLRIYKELLKFVFSSFLSFIIDYLLYTIFSAFTFNFVMANILARIISSIINYTFNRKIVFKSNSNIYISIIQYFSLAAVILLLNTSILSVFVNYFNIDKYIAKFITEVILFIFSWIIQKRIIFKRKYN